MTSKILAAAAVAILCLSLVPFGVVIIGMIVASGIVGYAVQLATGREAIVYETNETRTEEWDRRIAEAAAEKARRDAEEKRVADAEAKARAEEEARIQDAQHRFRIHSEILDDLAAAGLDPNQAALALDAIRDGSVRNLKIQY